MAEHSLCQLDQPTFESTRRYASGCGATRLISVTAHNGAKVALNGATEPTSVLAETDTRAWSVWETRTFRITPTAIGIITFTIAQNSSSAPNFDAVAIHVPGFLPDLDAPGITSEAAFSIDEGITAVGTMAANDFDDDQMKLAVIDSNDVRPSSSDWITGALTLAKSHAVDSTMKNIVGIEGSDDEAASTQSVTVVTHPIFGPTPTWSFKSVPASLNADKADISVGLDPAIAAVFDGDDVDDTDGPIGAACWQPGDAHSMNDALAQVWKINAELMVPAAGRNPDLVAIADDLTCPRFTQHIQVTCDLFGGTDLDDFDQTLTDAFAAYCSKTRKLWEEAGVDAVVVAISDQEIGDNHWPLGPRTDFVPAMKEAFGEHMVDPLGIAPTRNGVSAFAPEDTSHYDEGSHADQNKNALFLPIDVFHSAASDGVEAKVHAGKAEPVKGRVSILGPENSGRSSTVRLESGGQHSQQWPGNLPQTGRAAAPPYCRRILPRHPACSVAAPQRRGGSRSTDTPLATHRLAARSCGRLPNASYGPPRSAAPRQLSFQ